VATNPDPSWEEITAHGLEKHAAVFFITVFTKARQVRGSFLQKPFSVQSQNADPQPTTKLQDHPLFLPATAFNTLTVLSTVNRQPMTS
jgi:hypothetical protein